VDGAPMIRLLGNDIAVKAHIHTLGGFSAHAGQRQLLDWMRGLAARQPRIYLVHGEPDKSALLSDKIREETGLAARLPAPGQTIDL
jgi:metallo-beta-lactamase family protein